MTTTENRPSKYEEIESRARKIADEWILKDEDARMTRARSVARRQVEKERLAVLQADPAHYALPMARAGVQGLAVVWRGAPCPADTCVVPGFWSIDETGIYVQPEGHPRQFVASPIVETGRGGDFAALIGHKWVRITRPEVEGHPAASVYSRMVLDALQRAGVTFGPQVTSGVRADALETTPAAVFAVRWLTGYDALSDSIGGCPVRRFPNLRPEDDRPEGGEARMQLGGVLGRMPADVHRRRQ